MKYRILGKTGIKVSEIGFGSWAIGGTWGKVDDQNSVKALRAAVDEGVNFFDTADVYGDGRSEKLIAQLKKEFGDSIHIATKAGRRLNPHVSEGYNYKNLRKFVQRSADNLGTKQVELLQLHCPPTDVYYKPDVFEALDRLVEEGLILHYGVSVEKVEEAIKAIEFPNVESVQIIFNMFRQRPSDLFFKLASEKHVGVIARVPLASGLLTGKFTGQEKFEDDDHRKFNRNGESFDRGETFAGVNFEKGVETVNEIMRYVPAGWNMTDLALKWILMHQDVSTAITGAKTVEQISENTHASDLPDICDQLMQTIDRIYRDNIKPMVHQYW